MSIRIRFKQFPCFLNEFVFFGHYSKAAAMVNVEMCEVERQNKEFTFIDKHELVVIAGQVIGGPGDCHSCIEQAHFQFSKILFPTPIGIRNQGINGDSANDCRLKSRFNLGPIEPEDDNIDSRLCALNCSK
jgi:hypothetical protein